MALLEREVVLSKNGDLFRLVQHHYHQLQSWHDQHTGWRIQRTSAVIRLIHQLSATMPGYIYERLRDPNALQVQLERASEGNTAFASDAKRVQTALLALVTLKNQARTVRNQLQTVIYTWQEYQKQRTSLEQARDSERTAGALTERARTQVIQAQAELSDLQRVAASSNLEECADALRTLRERAEVLVGEIEEARLRHARVDERANGLVGTLSETEENLERAGESAPRKRMSFKSYSLPIRWSNSCILGDWRRRARACEPHKL